MEASIIRQFIILSIHPEKGRKIIHEPQFGHALAGAVLMDFLRHGEISLENRRIKVSFRRNGEVLHDTFAEMMEKPSRPRRISYWIGRIARKGRMVFRETMNSLVSAGIITHERRYFLNIIPYNRFYFNDPGIRREIHEGLRNVLLHDRIPTSGQLDLVALIKASGSWNLLALYKEEKKPLRRMCEKLGKDNELASEVEKAIRSMQAAAGSAAWFH